MEGDDVQCWSRYSRHSLRSNYLAFRKRKLDNESSKNEVNACKDHIQVNVGINILACVEMALESSFFLLFLFPLVYFDLFRSIRPEFTVIWLLPAEFRRNMHPSGVAVPLSVCAWSWRSLGAG